MQIYLRIIRSNISEKFVIVNYKYEIKHRNYLRTRIELRFRFRTRRNNINIAIN